jgi:cytochrome oxidase Cu insertion factor (SCO1/SenC/PrrC family)
MIKRTTLVAMLLLALVATIAGQQPTPSPPAQTAPPAPPKTHLKVGQPAPEFTLRDTAGKPVKLSDFKGKKNVVLAFYVLAFTGG